MVELRGITRHKIKDEKMETITYNGTTICVLGDMLTALPTHLDIAAQVVDDVNDDEIL